MPADNSKIGSVKIQGYDKQVIYRNLVLSQPVCDHHEFNFVWNAGDFKSDINFQLDVIKSFIGSTITISFKENEFNGIITDVSVDDRGANAQSFIVKGYSPTILADDVPRSASHTKKNLSAIAKKTLENLPDNAMSKSISPVTGDTLHYCTQYNETDFDFLCRLATRYGEWFYYDGSALVFGKPGDSGAKLKTGTDLDRIVFQASLQPNKYNYKSYDAHSGADISKKLSTLSKDIKNDFATSAINHSLSTYSIADDRAMHTFNVVNKGDLDALSKTDEAGINAKMLTVKGESKNPALKAGCKFSVDSQGGNYDYIITSVTHYSNLMGHYQNIFTAVPSTVKAPPYTNPHVFRSAGPQTATVVENHDSDGLGRIKVQFHWQEGSTPWLRVSSPHGGGGKGMHFIPEKGEEAIVDFEGGDVDKPFVAGTVYSGAAKVTYSNAENDLKVIQTRSGHVIELNDKEGAESITIKDKNNNIITIDTPGNCITLKDKNGNNVMIDAKSNGINITAKGSITLSAMNINLIAGATVNVQATAAFNLNALNSTSNVSMNTMLRTKNLSHMVGNILSASATTINQTAKKDINHKASGKMIISAKEKLDQHAGEMDVSTKDGKLRLKSNSDLEIKGSTVKTN
ncbi:MAG TPA: phage baseplate assembly protein V [Bacteroidia bacterium]|nr:phage baseplate assembly protein V [Bacteroidia bacterium]